MRLVRCHILFLLSLSNHMLGSLSYFCCPYLIICMRACLQHYCLLDKKQERRKDLRASHVTHDNDGNRCFYSSRDYKKGRKHRHTKPLERTTFKIRGALGCSSVDTYKHKEEEEDWRRRVGDAHLVAEMKGWVIADGSSIACGCCVVMVSSYAAALKGEEGKNGKRCRYEDF